LLHITRTIYTRKVPVIWSLLFPQSHSIHQQNPHFPSLPYKLAPPRYAELDQEAVPPNQIARIRLLDPQTWVSGASKGFGSCQLAKTPSLSNLPCLSCASLYVPLRPVQLTHQAPSSCGTIVAKMPARLLCRTLYTPALIVPT
jgi:hypothetical protein